MPDWAELTDAEIKKAMTMLWQLRQDATPTQDRQMREEMKRGRAVLDERQKARVIEAIRIAAETPGAVSAQIKGVSAGAGAGARAVGEV